MRRKFFLITIDTEGDNAWSKPEKITTKNAGYLLRFQELCERYGMKPVYLTNYEMCGDPVFQEMARTALAKQTAEVGAHLHAWHTPPEVKLTDNDYEHLPYLIEYPASVMEEKLTYLTGLLEDTFQTKMLSHRAGRWAFNQTYAKLLVKLGYKIDCSVTPYVSWTETKGAPDGKGGSNYRLFPAYAYCMNLDALDKLGNSPLLEVPVTVRPRSRRFIYSTAVKRLLGPGAATNLFNRFMPYPGDGDLIWFRPVLGNLKTMLWFLETVAADDSCDYIEFMIHSSEFMPGGSPYFPRKEDVDALFRDLEVLFETSQSQFKGATLQEYAAHYYATH